MLNQITKPLSIFAVAASLAACATAPADAHRGHQAKVVTVKVLPKAHRTYVVGGVTYYRHGGVYYRAHRGAYRVVAAPVGLRVTVLPNGYKTVRVKSGPVYVAGGTYYRATRNGYVVVKRPAGIVVRG